MPYRITAACVTIVLLFMNSTQAEEFVRANSVAMSMESRFAELEQRVNWMQGEYDKVGGSKSSCDDDWCCFPTGYYIGLNAGVQHRDIGVDLGLGTAAEWDDGFGVSGVLGHRFRSNLRLEAEFSLLDNNDTGFFLVFPTVREPSSGHISLRSLMANLYYDIPLDNWFPSLCRFRPYIGAGLGATESRINGVTSPTLQAGIPGVFGPTVLDTASRYTYTWQARIGFSYCLTRNSEFFGGYRHLETRTLEFRTEQFPEVIVAGANIDELEFGIRIFF